MSKEIYVLHERETKEHFIALEQLAFDESFEVKFREYLVFRFLLKSILKLDFSLLDKQLRNVVFLISCLITRDKTIVLGVAPLDFRLIVLKFILRNHRVYYFTSWSDWDGDFFPHRNLVGLYWVKKAWKIFLEKELSGLICVTDSALKNLTKNYVISCKKQVVYHSMNVDVDLSFKKKIEQKLHVVIVGRLEDSKGIKEIFEIIDLVDPSQFMFTFVGNGSLKKFVQNKSEEYSNVRFLGFLSRPELFSLYADSHIQLLISKKIGGWEELFGMVIIEAMSKGVPTIATNHIGPRQIIEDGKTGYLLEETYDIADKAAEILNTVSWNDLMNMQKVLLSSAKQYESKLISEKWKEVLRNG